MFVTTKAMLGISAVLALTAIAAVPGTANTAFQPATAAPQAPNTPAPTIAPTSPGVAAGETEAKKLLLLMDTDRSGKVSKTEFMSFMSAEFDRLDVNHDGELDVKELEQSQLVTARRGGTRR
jgi:hypothetical protein